MPPTALDHEIRTRLLEQFPILRFFDYTHLPPALGEVSQPFHETAWQIVQRGDHTAPAELTAGLRKLLEAKDCIVRAFLPS